MPYFKGFPQTSYVFGNEEYSVLFPNLTLYSDILDGILNAEGLYTRYYIKDGERPDNVSFKLYNTPDAAWSFYLLNDHLREQGWPLKETSLNTKIDESFPNKAVRTTGDIYEDFLPGTTVTGSSSNAVGKIVKRDVNTGQIFINTSDDFQSTGETLYCTEDGVFKSITITSAYNEADAVFYYKDSSGNQVSIDPGLSTPSSLTPITYRDYYTSQNNDLRSIKVLRKEMLAKVSAELKKVMTE